MTLEKAKNIAFEYFNSIYSVFGDKLVILDKETIEKDYGWYFFSQSEIFLETNDFRDMVAGNGPVLVEKKTGTVIRFGTAEPIETYIKLYENEML